MSPQFVDFDGDGHLDIVAGTFDGSPHVAFGTDQGWKQPEQILDCKGERILLNQFWNFDAKKWDETQRCDPQGFTLPPGQCTSAFAWDYDGDGVLDLLLGDYKGGNLYLRRNGGKAGAPAFATVNEPVLLGKEPLQVPHKMATPRIVDWDGDGLPDLVIGSMGDAYEGGEGGAVYLYRNIGKRGAPEWAQPVVLVEQSRKDSTAPLRPDAGLYMDVGDIDGDGDPDLIVGGYSMWKPAAPVLTGEQQARVAALQADLEKVDAETKAVLAEVDQAVKGLEEEAAAKKRQELIDGHKQDFADQSKRRKAIKTELEPMVSEPKRVSYVWLYENLAKRAPKSVGSR
jgi:hypothetical protein